LIPTALCIFAELTYLCKPRWTGSGCWAGGDGPKRGAVCGPKCGRRDKDKLVPASPHRSPKPGGTLAKGDPPAMGHRKPDAAGPKLFLALAHVEAGSEAGLKVD